ncbi:MAG: hypothetical protein AB4042_00055 [Leptolyngbyaceae cyanobacterium]
MNWVFRSRTYSVLGSDRLMLGSTAIDGGDRFIYNPATGALSFDPDGTGTQAPVQIASLIGRPTLSHTDIIVV